SDRGTVRPGSAAAEEFVHIAPGPFLLRFERADQRMPKRIAVGGGGFAARVAGNDVRRFGDDRTTGGPLRRQTTRRSGGAQSTPGAVTTMKSSTAESLSSIFAHVP